MYARVHVFACMLVSLEDGTVKPMKISDVANDKLRDEQTRVFLYNCCIAFARTKICASTQSQIDCSPACVPWCSVGLLSFL